MAYPTLQEVRDEGYSPLEYNDTRLQRALDHAIDFVENVTGRSFVPKRKTIFLNGSRSPVLFLQEPIIEINRIDIRDQFDGLTVVDSTSYRSYSRHLTDRLTEPDDRENPRIEFLSSRLPIFGAGFWPSGTQNVRVKGVFGYTDPTPNVGELVPGTSQITFNDNDPADDTITRDTGDFTADGFVAGQTIAVLGSASNDGSYTIQTAAALTLTLVSTDSLTAEGPVDADDLSIVSPDPAVDRGVTPNLIHRVITRIVARLIEPDSTVAGKKDDRLNRFRLIGERAGEFSLQYSKHPVQGTITGDPDIDNILIQFRRPPRLGKAGGRRRIITRRTPPIEPI